MELEKVRSRSSVVSGISGLDMGGGDDMLSGAADSGAMVTVTHVPYSERLPVGGMAVREVRERLRDRLDIGPGSQAIVDGAPVSEDTVLRAGQSLRFNRHSGEKGQDGSHEQGHH